MTEVKRCNKGEKAEVDCKKLLFERKNHSNFLVPIFGEDASEGIEIIDLLSGLPYSSVDQIKKTPAGSKADVVVLLKRTERSRYCSMKSLTGAKPAVLNHTPRSAKAFKEDGCLKSLLDNLDKLATEYIQKRKQQLIGEDIAFSKLDSSRNQDVRDSFVKLLVYFMFTGTGSAVAKNQCDSILIINKDGSLIFLDCDTEEKKINYVQSIIDSSVISFRNKGMPTKIGEDCLPWIYTNDINGKQCGSIHVRL
jgi:hypothetical protein